MSVLLSLLLATDPFPNWESAPVHSVTLTDEGEVLVCNVAQATLEIFSATTPPVWLDAVSVGLDLVSVRVRPDSREAWVVNHVSDSVSVIDLDRRVTIAVLPVLDEPGDVVFAGSPERAYVSCSTDECLLVFDPNNLDAAPGRIDLLGEEPKALAVDPSGHRVRGILALRQPHHGSRGREISTAVHLRMWCPTLQPCMGDKTSTQCAMGSCLLGPQVSRRLPEWD